MEESSVLNIDNTVSLSQKEACETIFTLKYYATTLTKNCFMFDADDLIQETAERVLNKLHMYDGNSSPRTRIAKIMLHKYYDMLRFYNRRIIGWESPDILDNLKWSNISDSSIYAQEILQKTSDLTPSRRRVFQMNTVDQLSHKEISHKLGIAISTSRSELTKAKRDLRKILIEGDYPEYKTIAI